MFRALALRPITLIDPSSMHLAASGLGALALLCLSAWPTTALAIGLGEMDVRSYLGEELNLRIGVIASPNESVDLNCFSVSGSSNGNSGAPQILRRDVVLSVVETRGARYLQIRGARSFNEPLARISIRAGCQGDSAISRDFFVLLDPPPALVPAAPERNDVSAPLPTVPASSPAADPAPTAESPTLAQGTGGRWKVYPGDTLNGIAGGIFPKSRSRREAYIAAMRDANPSLAGVAANAPLEVGKQLNLPDLQAVSRGAARSSRQELAAASPAEKTPSVRVADRPPKSANSAAKKTRRKTGNGEFALRLSGGEVDLSRSEGVSEEVRAQLRVKQMLLDADDQVAQLLALKNTVRQLEGRLNDMQSQLAAAPATATTTAAAAAAATNAGTAPASSALPASGVAEEPKAAAPPTAPTPALSTSIAKVPMESPGTRSGGMRVLGLSMTWFFSLLALVAVALAWFLSARSRRSADDKAIWTPPAEDAHAPVQAPTRAEARQVAPPTMADEEAARIAHERAEAERDAALLLAIRGKRPPETPAATPDFEATIKLDAPLEFDARPARFDLDSSPVTAVDFPLDAGDSPDEERMRRLRYMQERFPELASQTISIDDTDSVINAARAYHHDARIDAGRTNAGDGSRASELLNFAIEERPQESRFWLAQFEIYRLDNMAAEFTALANKFHLLFSHTEAWPKVRHIGHQLDPANPLFAAAGRAAEEGLRFDPDAENWLNAPMDFSNDNLPGELRTSLFSDHALAAADLEAIRAQLSTGRGPGAEH